MLGIFLKTMEVLRGEEKRSRGEEVGAEEESVAVTHLLNTY